jgi:oxygen-independent coproporphyrinogen-3 oxidase
MVTVAVDHPATAERRHLNAREYIETHRRRRHSNRVLHGHPAPLFWQRGAVSVPDIMAARTGSLREVPKSLNLYVATPYCLPTNPERCGFCLFPSEVYQGKGQLETYLGYLEREAEMYRPFLEGTPLTSVYFGGGTSNLYRADQYARLLRLVRALFPTLDGAEITLEGIPQLFTLEKLDAMRAAGVNRISIGVQQLDDELIAMSGRKQKAQHVFQTIEWCQKLGLRVSVDLIFGWPRQTVAAMLHDLDAMTRVGVDHLTHYELNVGGPTDFARNRAAELPSIDETLEMYRTGRDFLVSCGYRQVTTYDWENSASSAPQLRYEDQWRHRFSAASNGALTGSQTWGWGFAGISHFFGDRSNRGWTYMNHARIAEYFAALDAAEFPIERSFQYTDERDFRLTLLFQMLISMAIDRGVHAAATGDDVVADSPDIWDALAEREWVLIEPQRVLLIGDGVFYTPLIQNLLAHDRVEELRRGRVLLAGRDRQPENAT